MAQHGSLINQFAGHAEMPVMEVGDGMTELAWSDRYPYTVISRSTSGKTLEVQADDYRRTDSNGFSESQTYEFTPNPTGRVVKVRWSQQSGRFVGRDRTFVKGRSAYYDHTL